LERSAPTGRVDRLLRSPVGGGREQANPAANLRQEKNALHARMGAAFRKELRSINADVVQVPAGVGLQEAAQRYAQEPA